jgi:maleate isomerase
MEPTSLPNNLMARKLGIIVPSSNTTMEREFNLMADNRYTVHATRVKLNKVTFEELENMEQGVQVAASLLADARVDVIAYGCTSGSLFRGLGHDTELTNIIREKTGLPAVATSGCVINALRFLKARRVSVATPYINEINDLEKKFLSANGFEVLHIKGLGIEDNLEIGRTRDQKTIELAEEVNDKRAQAVFISCTNIPTISIIPQLEETLKKPVISSNTATLWATLKTISEDYGWIDCGRIFKSKAK